MKKMFLYEFSVPGEINSRYIEASCKEAAEGRADEICEGHSFLGGAVRPPVKLVGEILPDNFIKLSNGKIVKDIF
jgi:hypothetical protein